MSDRVGSMGTQTLSITILPVVTALNAKNVCLKHAFTGAAPGLLFWVGQLPGCLGGMVYSPDREDENFQK